MDFEPIPESKLGELAAKFDIVLGVTPQARGVNVGRSLSFTPQRTQCRIRRSMRRIKIDALWRRVVPRPLRLPKTASATA